MPWAVSIRSRQWVAVWVIGMDRKYSAGFNTRNIISMTKEEATLKILKVLNSRMAVMSKPMRDEALTLAEEYGITVKDLITEWTKIAERI
jgi:hypothetical protein